MDSSYHAYYSGPPDNSPRVTQNRFGPQLPNSRLPPKSPRIPRTQSVPAHASVGGASTLPRSPSGSREAKEARQAYLRQMQAENDRLCDNVAETYMVGAYQILATSFYSCIYMYFVCCLKLRYNL